MPEAATHVGSGKVASCTSSTTSGCLLVASDRISTFDVVLPTEIPDKGRVLTGLSAFWFARTRELVPNHLLALRPDGRSTECRKLEMLPLECVVRGYLTGSGWKDYQATGSVCGHVLADGLRDSDKLPEPIFTPATKAAGGPRREHRPRARRRARRAGALRRGRARLDRPLPLRLRVRGRARDPDRRHEVRVRARPGGAARARRRGLHARLVALLAGRRVRARTRAALVRQAVRARLLRDARLGQDRAGARAARGRRRRHARPLRRGVRAADRNRVRRLPRRPRTSCSDEGDDPRPAEARDPRPAGRGRPELAAPARLRGRRGPRRPRDRPRARRRATPRPPAPSSSGRASSCSRTR